MSVHLGEVLQWKYGAVADTEDGKITSWRHPSLPKPDEIQVAADIKEYIAYKASVLYQEKRKAEFPPIGDQLDALWKMLFAPLDDTDAKLVKAKIDEVKRKFPKPKE